MSVEEQQQMKEKYYAEAMRYMENAKETLTKAGKEDGFYKDKKYVKTACGIAYNGVLLALDTYLSLKGIKKTKGRKSIEYYEENISKLDEKLLNYLDSAYQILHLLGYCNGIKDTHVIKAGIDTAYTIIEKIKPEQIN